MAKSAKKKPAKAAKKTTVKAKSASKPKKAAPTKAKASAKKAAPAKKVASAKKATPKKVIAKKVVAKKVVAKKVVAKQVVAKEVKAPVAKKEKIKKEKVKKEKAVVALAADARTQTHKPAAAPLKLSPSQLNIFPIISQRPIAHKSTTVASNSQDKTRYSEEELKEFEALIHGKLNKSREEFRILKDTLTRTNDAGTDSTSGGNTKVLEDGAETAEKENLSQLAARQLKYITNLENALVRIKNGTYGICSVTGKLISKERLIAVPHTTQSIEAKMMKQD